MNGSKTRRSKAFRCVVAVLLLGVSLSVGATDTASAQGSITSEIIYTVDLATQSVFVSETFELARGAGSFETLIPEEAIDLTSSVAVTRTDIGELLDSVALTPGAARTVVMTYTINSAPERSSFGGARVNESYSGFSLWPFYATDVQVVLPTGFRSKGHGGLFEEFEVAKNSYEYGAEVRSNGALWGYWFIALKDTALATRTVDTGGDLIEIAGWESDPIWLDFTARYVADGVPVLQDLIGQPWPEENLRIFESTAPAREGYAGWYDRRASEIEISDSLDAATLLHELSHAWFNDRFYTDRWMVEGFAEEMSSEALFRLDGQISEPSDPGEIPGQFDGLARWRQRFFFEDTWELEHFGYETSWYVIDALGDEIGSDGITRTIGAMQSGRGVFSLEGESVLHPANDWRRFLDMLELEGGSIGAEELFRAWVVPEEDLPVLDQRRGSIAALESFADGDMASVPFGVRDAVSRWHFEEAASRLGEAKLVRVDLDHLSSKAEAAGLTLPPLLDELYLDSNQHFTLVRNLMSQAEQILDGFVAEPEQLTDSNRRNFEAGRFERVDIRLSDSIGNDLNQNRPPDSSSNLYLTSIGGLLVVCLASLALISRLRNGVMPEPAPEQPQSADFV